MKGWDQWLRKWEGRKFGLGKWKSHVHWGFEMIFREEGDFPPFAVGHWAVGERGSSVVGCV